MASRPDGSGDGPSGTRSVAQSLRQATQLLLQAAERLDSSGASSAGTVPDSPAFQLPSTASQIRNQIFRPRSRQSGRIRQRSTKYERKWNHSFVCLAQVGQCQPPDTSDRVRLGRAGLGEKKVSSVFDASPEELHEQLLDTFPRLRSGGGYECLKLEESTRRYLNPVPPPSGGYTPFYLKNVFQQAKVYLRPLQRCLDVSPADDEQVPGPSPREKCYNCNEMIPMFRLSEHLKTCNQDKSGDDTGSSDEELPKLNPKFIQHKGSDCILLDNEKQETEDEMVERAIRNSREDQMLLNATSFSELESIIISQVTSDTFELHVRRSHVMEDCLRGIQKRLFSPAKTLVVSFVGEQGMDFGGLRRELFSLVADNIKERFLEGQSQQLVFRHDLVALQDKIYQHLGCLVALSVAQGGIGVPYLSSNTYAYLCGKSIDDLESNTTEVPDVNSLDLIREINDSTDIEELRSVTTKNRCILIDVGFTLPADRVELSMKPAIIKSISLHHLLRSKAELDQFCEGLNCLRVLECMRAKPDLMKPYFSCPDCPLTAEAVRKLFTTIIYSPPGTQFRQKEEATYLMFLDLLDDCESGACDVTLNQVLSFFTGATTISPAGFMCCLGFSATDPYPTASTCSNELKLPMKYDDYTDFKSACHMAFSSHGGFGLA